jgi:hypothetical protein
MMSSKLARLVYGLSGRGSSVGKSPRLTRSVVAWLCHELDKR